MLMAATLAGCSSDDNEPQKLGAPSRPMIVDVEEIPISNGETPAPKSLISRATDFIRTATFNSFSMNYTVSKYDFTKTDGKWNTDKMWPSGVGNDDKIDFYAYSHGTFNYNSGTPYVSFTIEEAANNQYDLLVAEHKQISYSESHGLVTLSFDHACAILCFNVYLSSALSAKIGNSLTVNSIILRNVSSHGNYNYSTKSWSGQDTPRYYTLTDGPFTVTTTSQPLSCGYVFMIPQTREKNGETGSYLEIKYVRNDEEKTATIPINVNWEAGKLHTININIGTAVIAI